MKNRSPPSCGDAGVVDVDVLIVASVSCIYDLGARKPTKDGSPYEKGSNMERSSFKTRSMQFTHADADQSWNVSRAESFRTMPAHEEAAYRIGPRGI